MSEKAKDREEEKPAAASSAQEYVLVADSEDEALSTRLELPTDRGDRSLGAHTLSVYFPGALGLKYRNPQTGAYRVVETTGSKFLPPPDGWGSTLYLAFYPQARLSEANAKRKAAEDEADAYGARGDGGGATKQKRLERSTVLAERKCCDLVVLGLPYATTDQQMRAYFEQFGAVVVSQVKVDHKSGRAKGFGFVQFADYDSQVQVLANEDHVINGRTCQVKIPNTKVESGAQQTTKMFVGRLADTVTADELRSFFDDQVKRVGGGTARVVDVFIPRPFRAFAFVTLSDADCCRRVIAQRDFVMNGHSVCVSAAAPKDGPMGRADRRSQSPFTRRDYAYAGAPYGYPRSAERRPRPVDDYAWSAPASHYYDHGATYVRVSRAEMPPPQQRRVWQPDAAPPRLASPPAPGSNALPGAMGALNLSSSHQDAMNVALQAFWTALAANQKGVNSNNAESQWYVDGAKAVPSSGANEAEAPAAAASTAYYGN